jgi:hypothetical protein
MNEEQAKAVAEALGGSEWQSGGGIWLVVIRKQDGEIVVISDDAVCEYKNEDAFEESKADTTVFLR